MKKIWVITLFPEYFIPLIEYGVIGKALRGERKLKIDLRFIKPQDFTPKDFKGVDDSPYGGGAGQLMRVDVLGQAIESVGEKRFTICPHPRGVKWEQDQAQKLADMIVDESSTKDIVFVCGRYEGIDERFYELYCDQQYSLGDFILSGAELAVMAMLDSSLRLCEGVLGHDQALRDESFTNRLIEYPQYTRPKEYKGLVVPNVLLEGHHQKIESWRKLQSKKLTKDFRPDFLERE